MLWVFPRRLQRRSVLKGQLFPTQWRDCVPLLREGRRRKQRLGYVMCSTLPPRVYPGLCCVASLSDRPRVHLPHPAALPNGGAWMNGKASYTARESDLRWAVLDERSTQQSQSSLSMSSLPLPTFPGCLLLCFLSPEQVPHSPTPHSLVFP